MRAGILYAFSTSKLDKDPFYGKKAGKGSFLSKKCWNFIFVTAGHPVGVQYRNHR